MFNVLLNSRFVVHCDHLSSNDGKVDLVAPMMSRLLFVVVCDCY